MAKKEASAGARAKLFPLNMNLYVVIAIFVLIIFLSYLVVKPYLITVISAVIVAMIFYPVYSWISGKIKRKSLSSLLTTLAVLLVIVIPAGFFVSSVAEDAYSAYTSLKGAIDRNEIFIEDCKSGIICDANNKLKDLASELSRQDLFKKLGTQARDYSLKYGGDLIRVVFSFLLKIFIFLFVLFYLFRDGEKSLDYIRSIIPLDNKHTNEFIKSIKGTLYAIFYGLFLTALVQGVLSTLLYIILGLPSPIFLGFLTLIGALTIGTWIVWAPAGIWMLIDGLLSSNNVLITKGIILLAIGAVIISVLDNVLKPYLIGQRTTMALPLIMIGLFGGIQLFGLIGIFLGPVILSLFTVLIKIYMESDITER